MRTVLGSRLRVRASARSAAVGLVPGGGSSSLRRGNLANPSFLSTAGRWLGEELARGALAALMHQLMKTAQRVSEPPGDCRARQTIDEIRSQGFVLPVGGVLRSEKDLSRIHLAHRLTEKGCFHALRRALRRAAIPQGSPGKRRIRRETQHFLPFGKNRPDGPVGTCRGGSIAFQLSVVL